MYHYVCCSLLVATFTPFVPFLPLLLANWSFDIFLGHFYQVPISGTYLPRSHIFTFLVLYPSYNRSWLANGISRDGRASRG